jgi:hypothetical protein
VVGSVAPRAGELITVYASGGRWISEIGGRLANVPCGECNVPRGDLTLTMTNSLLETHSVSMLFNGIDEWTTRCVNQAVFRLSCRSGAETFSASYFVGGPCLTGNPATCIGSGASPFGLTLTIQSCDPFLLQYTTTSCPSLSGQGYTKLTITR